MELSTQRQRQVVAGTRGAAAHAAEDKTPSAVDTSAAGPTNEEKLFELAVRQAGGLPQAGKLKEQGLRLGWMNQFKDGYGASRSPFVTRILNTIKSKCGTPVYQEHLRHFVVQNSHFPYGMDPVECVEAILTEFPADRDVVVNETPSMARGFMSAVTFGAVLPNPKPKGTRGSSAQYYRLLSLEQLISLQSRGNTHDLKNDRQWVHAIFQRILPQHGAPHAGDHEGQLAYLGKAKATFDRIRLGRAFSYIPFYLMYHRLRIDWERTGSPATDPAVFQAFATIDRASYPFAVIPFKERPGNAGAEP